MSRVGLTGSRFFGPAKPGADYDFYAQDSPEVRAELLAEGFRQLRISGISGPNTTAVFRHGGGPGLPHVDIALMKSFDRKDLENRVMTTTPLRVLLRLAPKSFRWRIWNLVQRL